jgi:serine/threonine protein kinase
MTLNVGMQIGPYEILGRLGEGGMGEVFRARDARLGREVAIKTLSDDALDPIRRRRFEAEARSASALNHPNIVTIHEIGRAAATPFIVMELVDGRTLRDFLHAGPLSLRRTLDVSAQLADALAAAHEAGIVHRDLKPENVMVSRDGFAKILDFGLACSSGRGRKRRPERENTVTEEIPEGCVVGTAGYMSPEQASGQSVDFRSDQFAFGALVFEMLTGRRAFLRPTRAETLVAIIREELEPLTVLCPRAPVPLVWIVERCLAKIPEERYAATRDLARDLRSLRDHCSQIDSGSDGGSLRLEALPRSPRGSRAGGIAAALAALLASAFVLGEAHARRRRRRSVA